LRPSGTTGPRLRRRSTGRAVALSGLALLTLTACSSDELPTFAMPERDATNHASTILSLWQGSWIAALAVGALTWGLILWPVIAFRRKRGETGLPAHDPVRFGGAGLWADVRTAVGALPWVADEAPARTS